MPTFGLELQRPFDDNFRRLLTPGEIRDPGHAYHIGKLHALDCRGELARDRTTHRRLPGPARSCHKQEHRNDPMVRAIRSPAHAARVACCFAAQAVVSCPRPSRLLRWESGHDRFDAHDGLEIGAKHSRVPVR